MMDTAHANKTSSVFDGTSIKSIKTHGNHLLIFPTIPSSPIFSENRSTSRITFSILGPNSRRPLKNSPDVEDPLFDTNPRTN